MKLFILALLASLSIGASAAPARSIAYKTCWNNSVIPWTKPCPSPRPKGVPATKPPTPTTAPTPAPTPTPSPTPTQAPMPMPMPTPTPTPTPVPVPTGGLPPIVQPPSIPSNFDTAAEIVPADVPPSMFPDNVGALRFTCKASHVGYNDPIVFPGQAGASHLHMFFGNTLTDANSTYESLRTTGESSCQNKLNRSAYWVPALMNGRGQYVLPEYMSVYYKRPPASSDFCKQGTPSTMGVCVPMPRGLRMVFGRTMAGTSPNGGAYFNCSGEGSVPGIYETFAEAAKNCPTGALIAVDLDAPDCWNGQLDSADHRSHLSPAFQDGFGHLVCPKTHPYVIPTLHMAISYRTDDTLDRSGSTDPAVQTWYFASDRMPGMAPKPSGVTVHADYFGAWDDPVEKTWNDNCIDKLLSCIMGELGDGTMMKWPPVFSFTTDPNLADVPPHP